jgi:hypothetical protein
MMADPPSEHKSDEPKCKYCGKKIIDHDWEQQKICAQKLSEDNNLWK